MKLSKWHGLGNDYLLVEQAELPVPLTPERVKRICDYHFGVGSDGILEVVSVDGDQAEVVIWNPDGSTAELSGNGTRIAARWLARRARTEDVRILVGPRLVTARLRGERDVEQEMGAVEIGPPETIDVGGEEVELTPVSVGNPHAVIRVPAVADAPVARLGPAIENHARFPRRTNVGFMEVVDRGHIRLRVHERGTGETRACGTGACAAVAVGRRHGLLDENVQVDLPGGRLDIQWKGPGEPIWMTGPAERAFEGEVKP